MTMLHLLSMLMLMLMSIVAPADLSYKRTRREKKKRHTEISAAHYKSESWMCFDVNTKRKY